MNHQFHYQSYTQAERWLALHQLYSPSRQDSNCERIYQDAFASCAQHVSDSAQVIGLGCGGGRKDALLLSSLNQSYAKLRYVAADVSPSLVMQALSHVNETLKESKTVSSRGLVADFMTAEDLNEYWLLNATEKETHIFSFLGMLPNFNLSSSLNRLSQWLRKGDWLIISANLAPGIDYQAGCETIFPLYDNFETKQWLLTVMQELGFQLNVTDLSITIQGHEGIKRIEAWITFPQATSITYQNENFTFAQNEKFLLFYSNRFQPDKLEIQLQQMNLSLVSSHLTQSQEEGVWALRKES